MFEFLSLLCVSIIDFWFIVTVMFICSNINFIYNYLKLMISYVRKHFNSPAFLLHASLCLLYLTSYFTFFCFVYPLTAYFGYNWFYIFKLSTSIISGLSTTLLYIYLYQWDFSFHNFHISSCCLYLLREVPLTFVVKLV